MVVGRVIGFLAASLLLSSSLTAAEYHGRAMLGYYTAKEQLKEASDGAHSNDQQVYLGQFYFDALGLGPWKNEFVVDFRDKYDAFGQVDTENLVLIEANQPQLRQLAIKSPYENELFMWSAGRFPITPAGIVGNDGLELGYRWDKRLRLGLFTGLIPQNAVHSQDNLRLNSDARQAGAYAVYQVQGREWWDNTYWANALVAQQTQEDILAEGVELTDNATGTPVIPTLAADSAADDDAKETVTAMHWYTNAVYQPMRSLRLTSLATLYLAPRAYLRNGHLSLWRQLTPELSGTASLLRLDLSEYRRTRDVREKLAPSELTQAKVELKQKWNRTYALVGRGSYGVRGADGLNKAEASVGVQGSQLFDKRLAGSLFAGMRKNFQSQDTFVKMTAETWFKRLDATFDQQFAIEKHTDGSTYHPSITGLTLGAMLGDAVLGSLGVELVRDERATITSGLLTLGYRFNSRQMTPVRDLAPPVEALPNASARL